MEYIAHRRYDGKDMQGNEILIRRGKRLDRRGDVLYYDDKPVCIWRSLTAKQHFANNADGLGLQRGELTYKIAYAKRGDGSQRFTDAEQELLRRDWGQYLKPNVEVLLFNDEFFELPPDVLRQIAAAVNIN
ncbi:MAG: hypothetical protein IJ520_10750 [Synergistaceae bacterium]|nr:hypothetical protein [Synergistaceae bacterium]MBR1602711.1 hypothetical protein [Synergistaceae bacterium]